MIYFCIDKYNIKIGIIDNIKSANANPSSTLFSPKKKYWVNGIVLTSFFCKNVNDIWKSFHTFRVFKIIEVTTTGFNKGNTILIIEHNIEFIASIADYLIDFGLEGGESGGKIVSRGAVGDVIKDKASSWYGILD